MSILSKSIYPTIKLTSYTLAIGIKNGITGFSLISIPTFITYFGSNSHKLENGEEGIIVTLSMSLIGMNLVSNIGQEFSPLLCGEYAEVCKSFARVASFATQTYLFNQTIETGIVKGSVYEIFGHGALPFFTSEALGTIVEPIFSEIHYNITNNQTLNFDFKDNIQNSVSSNLVRDNIVSQHIYNALTCVYLPITEKMLPPLQCLYYTYLVSDFNSTAAFQTSKNLYEDAKSYFTGETPQHDEF